MLLTPQATECRGPKSGLKNEYFKYKTLILKAQQPGNK
jgi:hypothetical protein